MRQTIQAHLSKCLQCLRYTIVKRCFDPATPIVAAVPFDHLQMDLSVGLVRSKDGMTAILVIIDVCTGYIILRALKNTKATTIAHELWLI